MKLRAASVRKQLASLAAKTFPRLPSCTSDNEKCQAWEAVRPPVINVRAEGQIFTSEVAVDVGWWVGGAGGARGNGRRWEAARPPVVRARC